MSLLQVLNLTAKFNAVIDGVKTELTLLPWTLEVTAFIQLEIGVSANEFLATVHERPEALSKVAFFMMCEDDKAKFPPVEVKTIDLEGNEVVTKSGGYKLLMKAVQGAEQLTDLVQAMVDCFIDNKAQQDVAEVSSETGGAEKK